MRHRTAIIAVRHRTVIILALVMASLLLVEGILSFYDEDEIALSGRHDSVTVAIGNGGVYLDYFGFPSAGGPGVRFHRRQAFDPHYSNATILRNHYCLGFGYVSSVKKSDYLYFLIRLPLWFPLLLLAAICAIAIWRYRNTYYQFWIARQCVNCGYDVRASPERCPECGTPVQRLPTGLTATLRSMRARRVSF